MSARATPPLPWADATLAAELAASPQRRAHRQQQLEGLTAAVLRAISGDGRLSFRGRHARRADGTPLPWTAPHLRTDGYHGLPTYRAVADGLGLRQLFGSPAIHEAHAPSATLARTLYEWFEQLRVESLAPDTWPGLKHNLHQHFEHWTIAYHESPLIESHLGLLLFSVSQMVWSRLNRQPSLEAVIDTMEATRAGLHPILGDDLYQMSRHRLQPALFSPASARLAQTVADLIHDAQAEAQRFPADRSPPRNHTFFLWLDDDPAVDTALPVAATGESRSWEAQQGRYRIFTRQFDQELSAASRVRAALLDEYRTHLDQRLHLLSAPVGRLARQLSALLSRPVEADWAFQQESGRLDGRQLTRLVTSPLERRLFRQEAHPPRPDGAISLLLDCSGSMKAHAESLALFVELWARITGMAQIPFEVLGFTTASWHGGKARAQWLREGQPPWPGRLAERQHLVFKPFDQRWQRARPAFASLLKQDLYREGLDGEAVSWASERLLARPVSRPILMVISDGCPMEAATQQSHDPHYLDSHLKATIQQAQQNGIQVLGLGLGLDLSPFYTQHLAIEPDKLLHTATFQALLSRLAHPRGR
ncbi:MAG: cobalt chelatase [Lautropia sp.]|nr:cobalt chelatase [Lautropia sp.]